ncbi:MAG: c-type cytochrome, partial [Hydrogenophaga sp.]|nr:c-type cytochrome [Hydrogenophaga sp.]
TTKPAPKGPVGSVAPAPVVLAARTATGGADTKGMLNTNACTACHGLKSKIVGPGFNEIAAKYKGKADAEAYLEGKIKAGGSGVWGAVPMPAQDQLSAADAKTIAKWIVEGAK